MHADEILAGSIDAGPDPQPFGSELLPTKI